MTPEQLELAEATFERLAESLRQEIRDLGHRIDGLAGILGEDV